MTVPKYRENPLIKPFSLLCPGISQNSKHHQLTLYKGQVWGEKSYLELCNHNRVNIVYFQKANSVDTAIWPMEINNELYVPPVPGRGFITDQTNIPWDSEILQSFAQMTNITFNLESTKHHKYNKYQLIIGCLKCYGILHHRQCAPPYRYYPWYIWTKEGFKITD